MPAQFAAEEKPASADMSYGAGDGGRLFQRFTLQKLLGRGSSGIVWLARDDRLDHLVALKLIPDGVAFGLSEDLKREAHKSLLLGHPNIVRIFDFIEDEQNCAITMEYIDGVTLADLRRQKRARCFAVREIAPWVTSLCDALAYAHDSAGLIHRNLKPSNLMVNSRMNLRITDFGIPAARHDLSDPASEQANASSSLKYMSPQHLAGEEPTPSDDVYAVGATLYELLSSRPPFYKDDIAAQIREAIPPWISERREKLGIVGEAVPKHWEETIAACLAKNPAERPHGPVEIARRLRLGGTILLSAVQEESKVPGLVRSLTHARIVGAAAGIAALIAAAVLGLRAAHPTLSEIKQATESSLPEAYAMELQSSKESGSSKPILVPDAPPPGAGEFTPAPTLTPPAPKVGALQLSTTPSGARFAVFPGVVAGKTIPAVPPLHAGTAPESIQDLPPGHYTLFFQNEGWPEERTEVALEAGETLPVAYTFPHGSATITSAPDGAEIFFGTRSLGRAPLTVDLPLGKQQLTARYADRSERTQTVTVDSETPATVAFQLRQPSASPIRKKTKPPASALGKIGQSLKNVFTRKNPPPRKKG